MARKIEISIDVILHATEDVAKILESFENVLNLKEDDFALEQMQGHYENPITMLKARVAKRHAQNLMDRMLEVLPAEQVDELVCEIGQRVEDSKFHMRLDKQELIRGNLRVSKKDTVKLRIHTPIYNKKDTVKIFTEIFSDCLD